MTKRACALAMFLLFPRLTAAQSVDGPQLGDCP